MELTFGASKKPKKYIDEKYAIDKIVPKWSNSREVKFILDRPNNERLIDIHPNGHTISKVRNAMYQLFQMYMSSEEWNIVKKQVKRRDKYCCVDCGKKQLKGSGAIVHHTHYDAWGSGGQEEIASCVYLCKKCHSKRHQKMDSHITPFWAKQSYSIDEVTAASISNSMNLAFNNL